MADKESGVYLTIEDNSFETPGASAMVPLIIATTTKGKLGLNLVNANNFKNILGYDLKYNSNYYGGSPTIGKKQGTTTINQHTLYL